MQCARWVIVGGAAWFWGIMNLVAKMETNSREGRVMIWVN